MLYALIGFIVGVILSLISARFYERRRKDYDGVLRAVYGDEQPYLFLELNIPVDQVSEKTAVSLKVQKETYPL